MTGHTFTRPLFPRIVKRKCDLLLSVARTISKELRAQETSPTYVSRLVALYAKILDRRIRKRGR